VDTGHQGVVKKRYSYTIEHGHVQAAPHLSMTKPIQFASILRTKHEKQQHDETSFNLDMQ